MDESTRSAPIAKNLTLEDTWEHLEMCAYSYRELVEQCGSLANVRYVMSTGASDSSGMSTVWHGCFSSFCKWVPRAEMLAKDANDAKHVCRWRWEDGRKMVERWFMFQPLTVRQWKSTTHAGQCWTPLKERHQRWSPRSASASARRPWPMPAIHAPAEFAQLRHVGCSPTESVVYHHLQCIPWYINVYQGDIWWYTESMVYQCVYIYIYITICSDRCKGCHVAAVCWCVINCIIGLESSVLVPISTGAPKAKLLRKKNDAKNLPGRCKKIETPVKTASISETCRSCRISNKAFRALATTPGLDSPLWKATLRWSSRKLPLRLKSHGRG